jgi:hypothetical protein
VSFRPPARSSASLTVARPPAARTAATPEAEKRIVTSLTERLRSLTLREAAFAEPAVTVAVPRSAWRVGLATSIVALDAESEDGLGPIFTGAAEAPAGTASTASSGRRARRRSMSGRLQRRESGESRHSARRPMHPHSG